MADFEDLSRILGRRLRSRGLGQASEAAQICAVANRLSRGRFEAIRFRDNRLTLRAINALVAQELRFELAQLTEQIRQALHWAESRSLLITITLH